MWGGNFLYIMLFSTLSLWRRILLFWTADSDSPGQTMVAKNMVKALNIRYFQCPKLRIYSGINRITQLRFVQLLGVLEGWTQLWEACWNHFHLSWYLSGSMPWWCQVMVPNPGGSVKLLLLLVFYLLFFLCRFFDWVMSFVLFCLLGRSCFVFCFPFCWIYGFLLCCFCFWLLGWTLWN